MTEFFKNINKIKYEGTESTNPLAFKHMKDHLRFAACYWHNFCWPGSDVFGAGTFDRPWANG